MAIYRKFLNLPKESVQDSTVTGIYQIEQIQISVTFNGLTQHFNGSAIADVIKMLDERLRRIEELELVERFDKAKALK